MKTSCVLSFRVSEKDNEDVEHWVFNKKKFKSKSDFGSAAIRFYLDHLLMMEDYSVRIYDIDAAEEHH